MHTDRCGITSRQKFRGRGRRKEVKLQAFVYRGTTNVEHEMCGHTGNKGSQRNSTKGFKEKFGSDNRKTFDRLTTKDSCTWNITRNTESTAM